MNRSSQRGVALVITLIMLSVVTITAVAFLAVSRRERASVGAAGEQLDARNLAETALARARAEVASRILGSTNRSHYDLLVSTNFVTPVLNFALLDALANGNLNPASNEVFTNATTYLFPNGVPVFNLNNPVDVQRYRASLANLYFDPRPPVFVVTNRNPATRPEFRYTLDLNRNRQVDPNGIQPVYDQRRRVIGTNDLVGDPEWIGQLENPAAPHSGTNRFVGRYAYVVLPAGKTLDLNYVHNDAKRQFPRAGASVNPTLFRTSGFLRNQGVGSYEINLAGYFGQLNTNVWLPRFGASVAAYNYDANPSRSSFGLAFQDAGYLHYLRRGLPLQQTAFDFYRRAVPFAQDTIDNFSDGPLFGDLATFLRPQRLADNDTDRAGKAWAGLDNEVQYLDITRLVGGAVGNDLALRLNGSRNYQNQALASTYDQNTFYRLLGSLGTDSADARFESGIGPGTNFYRRAKLNLNYAPVTGDPDSESLLSASVATFQDWTPLGWFTNAVHRMLVAEIGAGLPDLKVLGTNANAHWAHGVPVAGFQVVNGLTNTFQYGARVHRVLQLAANIYDATHYASARRPGNPRPDLPSVFRPLFYQTRTNNGWFVRLAGFQEVVGDQAAGEAPWQIPPALARNRPWIDPEDPAVQGRRAADALGLSESPDPAEILQARKDFNFVGVPWVIGVKKGHPTFQEAYWQAQVKVTRRLRVAKTQRVTDALSRTNQRPWDDPRRFDTRAQYRYDIVTRAGAEGYNAYLGFSNNFPVRVTATNVIDLVVYDEARRQALYAVQGRVVSRTLDLAAGQWRPQNYLAVLNTNLFASFVYDHLNGRLYPAGDTNAGFVDVRLATPRLTLALTNRLTYWVQDNSAGPGSRGRLIDFVNLRSVMHETNLLRFLVYPGQSQSPDQAAQGLRMAQVWNPNYLTDAPVPSGIEWQMDASLGLTPAGQTVTVDPNFWRDPPGVRPVGQQLEYEKDGLYFFLFRQKRRPQTQFTEEFLRNFGGFVVQLPYTPSPDLLLTDRRMANDPLVHFTAEDLAPGQVIHTAPEGYTEVILSPLLRQPSNRPGVGFAVTERMMTNHLGNQPKVVSARAPWGENPDLGAAVPPADAPNSIAFDVAFKDPLVTTPDDWNFPTNKLAGIGLLGRVHRGTPWQTFYLKAKSPPAGTATIVDRFQGTKSWAAWAGSPLTRPENDRLFLDLFTTAPNDNAARGLLSVNQTNAAAWSAVLSGVRVLGDTNRATTNSVRVRQIEPGSAQLGRIIESIHQARSHYPGGRFRRLGDVLSAPALTAGYATNLVRFNGQWMLLPGTNLFVSPFLSPFEDVVTGTTRPAEVPDEVLEAIPQQILSLLHGDEPRVVVYAYGQSLKPAPNSIVTRPGPFFGLCTNYVVTGEHATRTVVRFDGSPYPNRNDLRAVVEDHQTLPPDN